jgi:hypothetical protein
MDRLAERKANAGADRFQGKAWQTYTDVMKSANGPALDWAALLRGGTLQFNRVGQTNDAGELINLPIRLTVGQTWALGAVNWNIFAPSDRLRIILNQKIRLLIGNEAGAVTGLLPVPLAVQQQLANYGILEVNRQRGNRVNSRLESYLEDAHQMAPQFTSTDAGVITTAFHALSRIPYELEVLPLGLASHLMIALDALNKQERCAFSLRAPGLDGVAVGAALPDTFEVYMVPEVAVWDGVLSGQGS